MPIACFIPDKGGACFSKAESSRGEALVGMAAKVYHGGDNDLLLWSLFPVSYFSDILPHCLPQLPRVPEAAASRSCLSY